MSLPGVWSCGGGTQSVAIGVLIAHCRIEQPDYAVIVDTGYEKSTTWEYMDRYLAPLMRANGVEIIRVPSTEFATVGLWGGKDKATALIPAFTPGNSGAAKLPNYCSYEWKRRVVERFMTSLGVKDYVSWIGFSLDESRRVQKSIPAKRPQRYPLIELGITRDECMAIVARAGFPTPPRSSCWMCPNQSDKEWQSMPADDFARAVEFEKDLREKDASLFLHRSLTPIGKAVLGDGMGDMFACESGECFV